jgi:hypothetical protein
MTIDSRKPEKKVSGIGNGPYLAKVISHLDPSFMCGLEVTLLRDQANDKGDELGTYFVRYITPFYGSTAYEFMGKNTANSEAFNDTQKSYGMWFSPPDIGVTVLVFFVDGNPASGYYLGCVPSRFMNHMIPGIAASTLTDSSPEESRKYDTSFPLPVAEVNRRANDLSQSTDIDRIKKPVHPITDRLLEQGLIEDGVRGTTTSTPRRESPSMVFGISTPGPLDKRPGAPRSYVGRKNTKSPSPVHVSRLGGTQFVMDDGDDRYQRKQPASQGPIEYVDILSGEKGDPTIPYNEHFRIRTRTGHQILLHNSEDLIYIGNAKGTTWIELSSNGKIDIFAEDSVSIHTKNDFNLRADRDINLEAGRNVNIKATAEYVLPTDLYGEKDIYDGAGFEKGRVYIESVENFDLLIGRNGKINVRNDEGTQSNFDIKVTGNMRVSVQDKDEEPTHTNVGEEKIEAEQSEDIKGLHIYSFENLRMTTKKNLDIVTEENVKIKTNGNLDLSTDGNNTFTAGGATDIKSGGKHTETAEQIHMNGPAARVAKIAEAADVSDRVRRLPVLSTLVTDKDLAWIDTRYQKEEPVLGIVPRVPMHEPWVWHEHFNPEIVNKENTDREKPQES